MTVEVLVCQGMARDLKGDGLMASIPVKQTPEVQSTETLEDRFHRLAAA
jgi:hypothetical protein